jgi:hypothetical protein
MTLKIYQQAVPAEVKAAALALEQDLLEQGENVNRRATPLGVSHEVVGGFWMGGNNSFAAKPLKELEPPAGIEPATC